MWVELYESWKEALANNNINAFFLKAEENSHEMRTTYQTLGNIERFTNYLRKRALWEINDYTEGEISSLNVGGFDE